MAIPWTREEFIGPETNLNRPCSRTGKAIQTCYRVKFIASYVLFSFVNKSFIEKHYKYMYVRPYITHVREHNTRFDDTMIAIFATVKVGMKL